MTLNNLGRTLISCGLLALSVYVTSVLWAGTTLGLHQVVPIWLPGGVMLTWLLRSQPRHVPALIAATVVGAIAANPLSSQFNIGSIFALNASHIAELAVCYLALRRALPGGFDPSKQQTMLAFLPAALGAVLVGAALSLPIVTHRFGHAAPLILVKWGMADLLGFVVVVPCLMIISQGRSLIRDHPFGRLGLLALAAAIIAAATVFTQSRYPLLFLVPPALMVASAELELLGAAIGVLAIMAIGVAATMAGVGPTFVTGGGLNERILVFQVFAAVLALSSLMMATISVQKRRMGQSLAASGDLARDQAQRAALAEEVTGVAHWRFELATCALTCSDGIFRIFGGDPSIPPTMDEIRERAHPIDRPAMDENFERAVRGELLNDVAVSRMYRSNGELCYISHRLVTHRDETGAVEAVFGALFDVTERTRAEMALIESEARFRLLADNMSDMVVRIGPEGEVLYTSPAIQRISGYGPEDSATKFGRGSVHPDDLAGFIDTVTKLRCGEMLPGTRLRHRRQRKDGSYVWLEGNPTAVVDENGDLVEVIDVVRDITAQKALEEELQAARDAAEAASKVKSQFLSNMSHELRTPLTAVLGFSSLLERQPDLSERSLSYVERLSTAGKALLSIINDVLDFSKLEAGRLDMAPQSISPADLIRDAVELFAVEAEAKGVALTVSGLEGLPPRVLADPDRLRQILLNLIGNAVKFTDAGEVRAGARYLKQGRLEVTITDTGLGIARNQQSRLFQRFSQIDGSSTRRHGGSGLGLAICKGLVEAMGGKIGVRSRPGAGSSFWFAIPVPASAEGGLESDEQAMPVPRRGARVLVVDDHPVNRQLVRAILEPFGVMVEEAGDGRSGVAISRERPFDLILMDMRMPDFDGRSAMTAIRGADGPNRTVPILAFSAENDDREAVPAEGFDGRLIKPLTASDLLTAVARFTGPRAAAPDLAPDLADETAA